MGFGAGGRAAADLQISTPTGLSAGETFRIVFITDATRDSTSTNIADYNAFVSNDATTEAGGGVVKYNGTTLSWSAIASTPFTNAFTNVGQTGAPIYLVDGTQVTGSDTSTGLWSGSLLNAISEDLKAQHNPETFIWTGTGPGGQGAYQGTLGAFYGPTLGQVVANSHWVDASSGGLPQSTLLPFYGISQELTVPSISSVPEPSTLWVASCGICAAIGWSCRRTEKRGRGRRSATLDPSEL